MFQAETLHPAGTDMLDRHVGGPDQALRGRAVAGRIDADHLGALIGRQHRCGCGYVASIASFADRVRARAGLTGPGSTIVSSTMVLI